MIQAIHLHTLTHILLHRAFQSDVPSLGQMKQCVFQALREGDFSKPDHHYKPALDAIFDKAKNSHAKLLINTLKYLTENHLLWHNGTLHVKFRHFASWQKILTYMPPSPLIAWFIHQHQGSRAADFIRNRPQRNLACVPQPIHHCNCSPQELSLHCDGPPSDPKVYRPFQFSLLPVPYHPMLKAFFDENLMIDPHVHLTGITQSDMVWQNALQHPRQTHRELRNAENRDVVREQYLQIHDAYDEKHLMENLLKSRALRDQLHHDKLKTNSQFRTFDHEKHTPPHAYHYHPKDPSQKLTYHEAELLWWLDRFKALERDEEAAAVHAYLLMQAAFHRMIVQEFRQKGFDQFQKITLNEMRSHVEAQYRSRFEQLGGENRLHLLEGRFAPKNTAHKTMALLNNIISGYEAFQGARHPKLTKPEHRKRRHPMELRLVAHFIKREETKSDLNFPVRHYKLRRDLARQARILASLRKSLPKLRSMLTGADAAANELHTPPEVFAPIFHYLRRHGWNDFTYHAGEDYRHLISGIRAIYEAVWYLGLCHGNRIGHATAIGIDPQFWLTQTAPETRISRGEWLDNLVFVYHLYTQAGQLPPAKIMHCLSNLHAQIYGWDSRNNSPVPLTTPDTMVQAWKMRGYDPLVYIMEDQSATSLQKEIREEHRLVQEAMQKDPLAKHCLTNYHRPRYREKAAELITVETNLLNLEELTYLQHQTIHFLNKRLVAIESMPTSNVRIAPYNNYKDHHIFRWLGVDDPNAPCPTVVLASDDPGIFANHIHAEYAHVLETLVEHKGKSHDEAMVYLHRLNRNSRNFCFGIDGSLASPGYPNQSHRDPYLD